MTLSFGIVLICFGCLVQMCVSRAQEGLHGDLIAFGGSSKFPYSGSVFNLKPSSSGLARTYMGEIDAVGVPMQPFTGPCFDPSGYLYFSVTSYYAPRALTATLLDYITDSSGGAMDLAVNATFLLCHPTEGFLYLLGMPEGGGAPGFYVLDGDYPKLLGSLPSGISLALDSSTTLTRDSFIQVMKPTYDTQFMAILNLTNANLVRNVSVSLYAADVQAIHYDTLKQRLLAVFIDPTQPAVMKIGTIDMQYGEVDSLFTTPKNFAATSIAHSYFCLSCRTLIIELDDQRHPFTNVIEVNVDTGATVVLAQQNWDLHHFVRAPN
jgi:hypothetical protein